MYAVVVLLLLAVVVVVVVVDTYCLHFPIIQTNITIIMTISSLSS